jgi:hypothetical protein
MQVLINIENSKTPVDRSRSVTPVRRNTGLSVNSASKPPNPNFMKTKNQGSKYSYDFTTIQRGSITTSITTSKIDVDKGFTGPKFIEDNLSDNIPIGDEIPEYFAEDFDFSVPNP